jgi:hypothetical protein
MNVVDSNICLEAFNQLCDDLSTSNLVSTDDYQYWMFERGYKAALSELISNMTIAAKSQGEVTLDKAYLSRKAS